MGLTTVTSISLLLTLLTLGDVLADDQSPIVTLPQGTLKGLKVTSQKFNPYYAFLGIPFGVPPVGDMRFKAPIPAGAWNGTLEAVQEASVCRQLNGNSISGDEDCLYLNVFTPQLPSSEPLRPVMVWIHGGGFTAGSGNRAGQGPEYFLDTGIVYVSINYRLGVLGFFSTEDAEAPGNAAMKDQILALRWVQQNIAAFGGDPSKVTIFGESAGGASVSHLMLSPMSKGLFRAAIADSGSAASRWAIVDNPRENAFLIGKALGFSGETSQELVAFLRNANVDDIIRTSFVTINPEDQYRVSGIHGAPSVEPVLEGEEPFLTELPDTILEQGTFNKVPFMTGVNADEGLLDTVILLGQGRNFEELDQNFLKSFKPELRFCRNDVCGDEMVAKIRTFYYGNQSLSWNNLQTFIDMTTDVFFAEGTLHSVRMMSALSSAPVYFFHFIYAGNSSQSWGFPNITGPGHGDELGYLFNRGVEIPDDSDDAKVRSRMVSMWTNFVKTGNPTPEVSDEFPAWLPYKNDATNYLEIGVQLQAKTDYNKERMDFWYNLYDHRK